MWRFSSVLAMQSNLSSFWLQKGNRLWFPFAYRFQSVALMKLQSVTRISFKDMLFDQTNVAGITNTELNKFVASPCSTNILFSLSLFPLFSAPQHFVLSPPFSSPTSSLFMALCLSPPNGYWPKKDRREELYIRDHRHSQGCFIFSFYSEESWRNDDAF